MFQTQIQCVYLVTLSHNKSTTIIILLTCTWSSYLTMEAFFLELVPCWSLPQSCLEFISAQSPQFMKGLLLGVFLAIRGLFQFFNSIVIIPLSLKQLWAIREMVDHPPVTNCGFVYLVLTSVTGLIGLILFSLAAKMDKYRTRDEEMFTMWRRSMVVM